ncbi:DUF222 domain-containing protein [Dietzia aurantiaca]|uniref:DUF222 domain-containing protein n=1 Tax=Dietzia aurantiaca TaxID=983873 RepID=UPI001E446763|nr:DUF222 domain-containing protein [Dietzia aurantiaca]
MTQGVRDTNGRGAVMAPLDDVLAFLEASIETLCAVDWAGYDAGQLADAVTRTEIVARRLESAGSRATAELAGLHQQKGRSPGGVAALLAAKLGLARGTVHGRIEAGGRQATPAGRAAARGVISCEHERIIAKAVAGLPGKMGGAAKTRLAEELTQFARTAAPADLRAEVARRLAELCPDRGKDREKHQERQRSARLGAVRPDGTSMLTMTLTPRGRALVERALCDFGGPGGAVGCEPGSDERAPEQRAHDALVHQWALGSTVDPARPKGIATIVIRLTPEQLEDPMRSSAPTQAPSSACVRPSRWPAACHGSSPCCVTAARSYTASTWTPTPGAGWPRPSRGWSSTPHTEGAPSRVARSRRDEVSSTTCSNGPEAGRPQSPTAHSGAMSTTGSSATVRPVGKPSRTRTVPAAVPGCRPAPIDSPPPDPCLRVGRLRSAGPCLGDWTFPAPSHLAIPRSSGVLVW